MFSCKRKEKYNVALQNGNAVLAGISHSAMVPRETVSFAFPRVLMFPKTKSRETSGLEGKQN